MITDRARTSLTLVPVQSQAPSAGPGNSAPHQPSVTGPHDRLIKVDADAIRWGGAVIPRNAPDGAAARQQRGEAALVGFAIRERPRRAHLVATLECAEEG